MNSKKRKLPVSTLALFGVGALVAFLVFQVLTIGKTTIVVANQDIEPRTLITEEMLTTKTVSEDSIPADAIRDSERNKIVGKVAAKHIVKDVPIVPSQILGEENRSVITAQIPEGYIGATIPVTNVTGYSPSISEFERINVTANIKFENNFTVSKVILQNVQVLGVLRDPNNENNIVGINVAIPPEKSELLDFAITRGTVTIQVVPYGYKEITTNSMTDDQFFRSYVNNAGAKAEAEADQNNAENAGNRRSEEGILNGTEDSRFAGG